MTESTGNLHAAHVASSRQHFPVTVVLERHRVSRSFWSVPVWRLGGVLVGEHLSHEPTTDHALNSPLREPARPEAAATDTMNVASIEVAGADDEPAGTPDAGPIRRHRESVDAFSWAGFSVTLYRDACERYWHALIGDQPRVYVICHEMPADRADGGEPTAGGQSALRPVKVTVDYDEAIAYGDTDQQVLSAPIPGELYRHMEAFVLTHYKPQAFKKRKRRDWHAETEQAVHGSDSPAHVAGKHRS